MATVPASRHLLRAKDLIDTRYLDSLDVRALAQAARLSSAHFSREFRRAFGETPHQYLLTRRLERAAALFAVDRSQRRRHLLHGRLAQRRIVHDELRPNLRLLANRLPCSASARNPPCSDPDLCAAGVGASAIEQFSRRPGDGLGLTSLSTY